MLLDPGLLHLRNLRSSELFAIRFFPDVFIDMEELLELVQIRAFRLERNLVLRHELFVILSLLIVKKSVDIDGGILEPRVLQDFQVAVFGTKPIRLILV